MGRGRRLRFTLMKTDLALPQIVAFARLTEALGEKEGVCPCNAFCRTGPDPSCCETKCTCFGVHKGEVAAIMTDPGFEKIVEAFDAQNVKTISDFIALAESIRDKLSS